MSASPIIMNFNEAVQEILDNKKVSRYDWKDEETYIFLNENILSIKKEDGIHPLIVSDADMIAEDWMVVG